MEEPMIGYCAYCGQAAQTRGDTQEEANKLATKMCTCEGVIKERRVRAIIDDAQNRAADLFGEGGADDGFAMVHSEGIGELINAAIERVAYGELREVSMQITGCGAAKIAATKGGGVRITRSRKMQKSEETV